MNDQNPYGSPSRDGARRGDRFWIGALVGCLGAVVLMFLLLVVVVAGVFFVRVGSFQGAPPAEMVEELEEPEVEMLDELDEVEVVPETN